MRLFFLALGVFLLLSSSITLAAPAPPGVTRELQRRQDQLLLQQEDRLRRQEREFLDPGKAPSTPVKPDLLPHVDGQAGAPCMDVRQVSVSGATLLSEGDLSGLTALYTGRCLSLADINNLLRDISNEYIKRGYVTSRAFADPSGQEPGLLRVLVVEGSIEKIIVNDGDPNSYYRGRTAFPFLEGKPLNLRDLEQGLDQLNRLPSAEATMEFTPGESMGGTIVKVTNRARRSWRAGLGFDNLGQRSTGRGMYNLSLEKDNLMGIGDQFAVYWSEDIPFWEDNIRGAERIGSNNSLSAYWSLPFGYWTLSGNFSYYKYDTTIFGFNTSYRLNGETTNVGARLERVLHRDAESKTGVSLGLGYRKVDTFIEGYLLAGSSYNLATFSVGVSHNRRLFGGAGGVSLDYTRGLHAFGATEPGSASHFTPQSLFNKVSASVSYYRPFSVLAQSCYWNLSAYGQWSPQTLYGSERIQIGGLSSVRGFLDDSLTGDQGGYVRNEIGADLPWFEALKSTGPLRGLQVYAAYDWGMLHPESRDRFERGHMQGMALGLRSTGDLSLDICVAKALEHPSFIKTEDVAFYLSAKYVF